MTTANEILADIFDNHRQEIIISVLEELIAEEEAILAGYIEELLYVPNDSPSKRSFPCSTKKQRQV